jgi:endonuclease YncB( thermonuclease family)
MGVVPAVAVADAGTDRIMLTGEAVAVTGNTLIVDGRCVRIHALHAPQMDEPGGEDARDMAALAVYGEQVTCDVVETGRHGRLVADCTMGSDGADFAEVMIRAGFAGHCRRFGRPDLAAIPGNGLALPDYCR